MPQNPLNLSLNSLKLESKLAELKKKSNSLYRTMKMGNDVEARVIIQSLLFPKKKYSVANAKKWAKSKGFKTDAVEGKNDKFIHLRQINPKKVAKFTGKVMVKKVSKFSKITSKEQIKLPLEVEMYFMKEGQNRDGFVKREELISSKDMWVSLPIVNAPHDMTNLNKPTEYRINDRVGYVGTKPRTVTKDGVTWIVNDAYITDASLAYLLITAEKVGKPLEISPEYGYNTESIGMVDYQVNLSPHYIVIVDEGHLEGNTIKIKK